MKSKVLENQSLFDIAIQECGSAEAAYDIAKLNGLSVTDELTPGQELNIPTPENRNIASYYRQRNIKPATASTINYQSENRWWFPEMPIEFE